MVEHLATLVQHFPGAANQTRCFTHILNLVAKSVLRQFDVAKKTASASPDVNNAAHALASLAQELEDSAVPIDDDSEEDGDDDSGDDDDDSGLGEGMSEEELAELEQSLIPVQLMLTKVTHNYLIRNYLIFCTAPDSCQRHQEFVNYYPSPMARKA
jgi:hypothetical protein